MVRPHLPSCGDEYAPRFPQRIFVTSCSGSYAVQYAARVAPFSSGSDATAAAFRAYAAALAIFTFVIVGFIDIMYLTCGLPRWILSGPPAVPAPPPVAPTAAAALGDKLCCKCWPS